MFTVYDYQSLCDVFVRHSYFLNDGQTDFDDLPEAAQNDMLSKYELTDVLTLVPSVKTTIVMRNHLMVVKNNNQRMRLMVRTKGGNPKPLTGMSEDTVFVFGLKINHPLFSYFTDVTTEAGRILLFPNNQPDELLTSVPLIPLLDDPIRVDDTFLLSTDDTTTLLNAWFPGESRIGLLGLIYLKVKGNTTAYDLLSATGETQVAFPQFDIHFNTQSTHWKYKRESAGFEAETTNALPLTKHGFIEIDPSTDFTAPPPSEALDYSYPNPLLETFEITPTKTYSVIFI